MVRFLDPGVAVLSVRRLGAMQAELVEELGRHGAAKLNLAQT